MRIVYSNHALKFIKKQDLNSRSVIDEVISTLLSNPYIGDKKSGDLSYLRVYKFKLNNQQYLIAYFIGKDILTIKLIGTHENFYKKLKEIL